MGRRHLGLRYVSIGVPVAKLGKFVDTFDDTVAGSAKKQIKAGGFTKPEIGYGVVFDVRAFDQLDP